MLQDWARGQNQVLYENSKEYWPGVYRHLRSLILVYHAIAFNGSRED